MNCPYCGAAFESGTFCPACGASMQAPPAPYAPAPQVVYPAVQEDETRSFFSRYPEYKPMSAWAYFGLTLLYSVPVVGLIFLIIFTFNKGNLNRRSFTRSYWIWLLIAAIAAGVMVALGYSFAALL